MQKRFRIPLASLNALRERYKESDTALLTVVTSYDGLAFDYVTQKEADKRGDNMQYVTHINPDPEDSNVLIVDVMDEIQSTDSR